MRITGLLALLLACLPCEGQELVKSTLTPNSGLPSSSLYRIIQDRDGFIWLGTDSGLAKYDGKRFTLFTTKEGMPQNTIMSVLPSSDGSIWVVTLNNRIAYVKQNRVFQYEYSISPQSTAQQMGAHPMQLLEDTAGIKWLYNAKEGVLLKNTHDHVFERIEAELHHEFALREYTIRSRRTGLFTGSISSTNAHKPKHTLLWQNRRLALEDSMTQKFFATSQRLFFRELANGEIIGIDVQGNYLRMKYGQFLAFGNCNISGINDVYHDREGHLWLLTNDGVGFYKNGDLTHGEHLLKGCFITAALHDNEGNYWFADHEKGLHKVASTNIRYFDVAAKYLPLQMASLKARNNRLWFSTINGNLWAVDSAMHGSKVFEDLREPSDFYPFEILDNNAMVLPGPMIVSSEGKVLVNKSISGHLSYKSIDRFADDIYMGITSGVLAIDSSGATRYASNPIFETAGKGHDAFTYRSNAVFKDDIGLWIGSAEGLFLKTNKGIRTLSGTNDILKSRIMVIEPYGKEHLLIGTKGNGVLCFHKKTETLSVIDQSVGLPSDLITSLLLHDSLLFVGTQKGLSVFTSREKGRFHHFGNYNIHNGLPSNEVTSTAAYQRLIWIGTKDGLVYLNPRKLETNTSPPPVHITQIATDDTLFLLFGQNEPLVFKERNLIFSFNGVGFRSGDRLQYKYFLLGFDQDTGRTLSTEMRYTNLPPGKHTFHVWARNEDGIWTINPAKVSFSIPEKFTETAWFVGTLLLLALALLASLFYLFNRGKKKRLEADIQTLELKQQALAALMNPHFIYNSLAAIQHFINSDEIEKSNIYLARFGKLVRQNLDSVRKGSIPLEEEMERLALYLEIEKIRFGDQLEYHITMSEGLDPIGIEIPAMILQPFVENAIWHGILPLRRKGTIAIYFEMKGTQTLRTTIKDNGKGFQKEALEQEKPKHTSASIAITKERLTLLSKKSSGEAHLTIESNGKEEGTLVTIDIPLNSH